MNKIFSLLLICCFTFAGLQMQAGNVESTECNQSIDTNNSLAFETTTMDYGSIKRGANGERVFKFKNISNKPVAIASAKGSCGCTVPSFPNEMIQPGASNEIKVMYDTNRLGKFSKTVTVTTSTGEVIRLVVKGEVTA